jgi:predicted ABC-type ATPase
MSKLIKRLRVFAGPNGSGKTTLYNYLEQIRAFHSYYHINPDLIAKDLKISLNLDNWPINFSYDDLFAFLKKSPFQSMAKLDFADLLAYQEHRLSLKRPLFEKNSYLAAAIADFLRIKMLDSDSSFSFESVFSHISKICELENAKKANFKIYLYFITTCDPVINLQRIKNRVKSGGQDVPEDKIFKRYPRTMKHLYAAFKLADRAYFFDNSKEKTNGSFHFFAEKSGNKLYLSDPNSIPQWFYDFVLKQLENYES